jgi:endo-1,4-beta-xylanase
MGFVMGMTRRKFLAAASMAGASSALGASAWAQAKDASSKKADPAVESLRETGARSGLLVGCAVKSLRLRDTPEYAALVKSQASILVDENAWKFTSQLRPSPDQFDFTATDYLADFAEDNDMKLRGHNFVWHRQLPTWFDGYVTKANAAMVLVEHIERVAGHYAGRIHSWDVVNEAIHVSDGMPGGLRNSPWYKLLGAGYIDLAFRTARQADPKALLVYNDYGIEADGPGDSAKRKAMLEMLRGMQQRGVPVDALGIQSHISARTGAKYGAALQQLIADAREMGLKVLLTEMDVNDNALAPPLPARDATVAAVYRAYLNLTLADPAVIALLTWGITDRYTWLNGEDSRKDGLPERPLPFDEKLQPKQAFFAELKAIQSAPVR